MNEAKQTHLRQLIGTDEEAAFSYFRKHFFEALEQYQFEECRNLLAVLGESHSVTMQQASQHYTGILLFDEQRQLDRAETIFRNLLRQELSPIQSARTLLALAILLDEQGQWSEAEQLYHQALDIYKRISNELGQARTYNNLGILLTFQVEQGVGDHQRLDEAIAYHRMAQKLAVSAEDEREVAKNWHGLGKAYSLLGRYDEALDAFERYLAACEMPDDAHTRGYTLDDMAALVYLPLGRYAEAQAALDEAIDIHRNLGDDLRLAEALTHRGDLYARQNHFAEAFASYEQAITCIESIRSRLTAPTAKVANRALSEFVYAAPVSLHLHQGNPASAFDAAERSRARVLVDLLAGQEARPHTDLPPALLAQRDHLRQRLEQAYQQESPQDNLKQLEASLADIDRQIELLDPAYIALESMAPITAHEVQQRLPKDAVLLTYVIDTEDRFWALVVTPETVQARPIPKLTGAWLRGYLADHLDGSRRGILTPAPQTGHLASPKKLFPPLFKALVQPVWDLLEPAQTVYITPTGPLHYLPLGALTPDLASIPPLLKPGRRVVYAPSATVLFHYCHQRPASPHRGILAIAPHDETLHFIEGAAQTLMNYGEDSAAFVGADATRQTFLEQAGNYRVLCFLGHALFDHQHPMLSRLQLTDGSLRASEMLRSLRLQADLVMLAACESGRAQVLRGDEIMGLSRAILYAGTPSLLATLWPVHEIPTRLLIEAFIKELYSESASHQTFDPASALAAAQRWLSALTFEQAQTLLSSWDELSEHEASAHLTQLWQMTHPETVPNNDDQLFNHPFFWSPYILIGDQRPTEAMSE